MKDILNKVGFCVVVGVAIAYYVELPVLFQIVDHAHSILNTLIAPHTPILEAVARHVDFLEGYSFVIKMGWPRISFLDLVGSMLVCRTYRLNVKTAKSWLECLVACTLMQFGGTTVTGILLGQTPSWIMSRTAYPAFLVAWWMTFCCPVSLYWSMMQNSLVLYVLGFYSAVSTGHAVTSWGMDKAIYNAYHTDRVLSPLVCLLCGTFSGCMGGILCDWLSFLRTPSFTVTTPAIFTTPLARKTILNAFVNSCVYYLYMNPASYLPWQSGAKPFGHLIVVSLQLIFFHWDQLLPSVHLAGNIVDNALSCMLVPASIEPLISTEQVEKTTKESKKNK